MKGSDYNLGYKEALESAKRTRQINFGMGIAIIILTILAFGKRERVVIVPPLINDRYEIAYDSANKNYHENWGLYVAQFMGNINPGNASFIEEGLQKQFSPKLYEEVRSEIMDQAERMRQTGKSLRFYPDSIVFEKQSGKTFVTGKQEIESSTGAVTEKEVVYEMKIEIQNGIPQVIAYDYYEGAPRTQDYLAKHSATVGANR